MIDSIHKLKVKDSHRRIVMVKTMPIINLSYWYSYWHSCTYYYNNCYKLLNILIHVVIYLISVTVAAMFSNRLMVESRHSFSKYYCYYFIVPAVDITINVRPKLMHTLILGDLGLTDIISCFY